MERNADQAEASARWQTIGSEVRLDGWPDRDLNVGAIAPDLSALLSLKF
jgi:hypothetical protein